jgi:hypothetical protein
MNKGLIASAIIALTSFSFNAFPAKGMTEPGEDGPIATNYVPNSQTKYTIRCYGGCDPYERINVFVTVQKGFINFKNSDLFIIKDDDVTVNSITYYQFTNYKSKYTLQQIPNGYFKDSPLNCYSYHSILILSHYCPLSTT